jgi:hypothetical protein
VKITVVVNEVGQVIAAHVPVSSAGPSDSYADEEGRMTGFVPSEGQQVLELDIPDEDAPSEPQADFLNTLQRYKDRGSSEATS